MLGCILAAVCLGVGDGSEVRLSAGSWISRPFGRMRFDEAPRRGTRLRLSDDLGVDEWDPGAWGEIHIRVAGLEVRADASRVHWTGRRRAPEAFRFNESDVASGSDVDTDIGFWQVRLGLLAHVVDTGGWRIGMGAAVRYLRFELQLSSAATEDDDDTLGEGLPEGLLTLERDRGPWTASLTLAAGGMDAPGLRVSAAELTARAGWTSGAWTLSVGWHAGWVRARSTDAVQDNRIEISASGPVVSVEIRF